jgi:hypothetical protein
MIIKPQQNLLHKRQWELCQKSDETLPAPAEVEKNIKDATVDKKIKEIDAYIILMRSVNIFGEMS